MKINIKNIGEACFCGSNECLTASEEYRVQRGARFSKSRPDIIICPKEFEKLFGFTLEPGQTAVVEINFNRMV